MALPGMISLVVSIAVFAHGKIYPKEMPLVELLCSSNKLSPFCTLKKAKRCPIDASSLDVRYKESKIQI